MMRPSFGTLIIAPFLLLLFVANTRATSENVDTAIGQLFEFGLTGDQVDTRTLPVWIGFDADESKIYGVPRWDHLENVTLQTKNGDEVRISLRVELGVCDQKDYVFVEVYDDKEFSALSLSELRTKIKDFAENFEIAPTEVRAYSAADLDKYRHVTESAITLDYVARPTQLVLWTRIACGDFIEQPETEIYEKAAEQKAMDKLVRLGQAEILRDNVLALQTATPASFMRTTRAVVDAKPVLYNKINTIKCKRGLHCQRWLPYNTFTDEDGNLNKLRPKVFSVGEHPTFLNISYGKETIALEGIALETGTFGFRLEVRDRLNQVADAPFNVEVEDTPQANHAFEMLMDSRMEKFQAQPSLLVTFVRRLIDSVGGRPEDILIEGLERQSDTQTLLRWSNHSFSRKSCADRQINETRAKMLTQKQRVSHEFRKAMGAEFHLANVTVQLRDTCTQPGSTTTKIQIFNVRASTMQTPHSEEQAGGLSTGLLVALIVIAVLLLLAVFILIYFCLQRKRPGYKMAKNNGEYATKGHPVVFPDEMPAQEDETNGAHAAVTTPMLVANEHPPLNPPSSEPNTTLHENPLYKPPASHENAHGTPTRTAVGQRLPPPYVAP